MNKPATVPQRRIRKGGSGKRKVTFEGLKSDFLGVMCLSDAPFVYHEMLHDTFTLYPLFKAPTRYGSRILELYNGGDVFVGSAFFALMIIIIIIIVIIVITIVMIIVIMIIMIIVMIVIILMMIIVNIFTSAFFASPLRGTVNLSRTINDSYDSYTRSIATIRHCML